MLKVDSARHAPPSPLTSLTLLCTDFYMVHVLCGVLPSAWAAASFLRGPPLTPAHCAPLAAPPWHRAAWPLFLLRFSLNHRLTATWKGRVATRLSPGYQARSHGDAHRTVKGHTSAFVDSLHTPPIRLWFRAALGAWDSQTPCFLSPAARGRPWDHCCVWGLRHWQCPFCPAGESARPISPRDLGLQPRALSGWALVPQSCVCRAPSGHPCPIFSQEGPSVQAVRPPNGCDLHLRAHPHTPTSGCQGCRPEPEARQNLFEDVASEQRPERKCVGQQGHRVCFLCLMNKRRPVRLGLREQGDKRAGSRIMGHLEATLS
ncbi:hypothetical protein Cadr_000021496 [Camelus dromedarius]|uniref:Uncharacterized protein n=1 Tax=Camelus dromedarius TaxID=9838 RepID=A0A5N4CTU0_CAMDR|nr:hypothetical protein Cadr_000021496 [Camelus dromedarius]